MFMISHEKFSRSLYVMRMVYSYGEINVVNFVLAPRQSFAGSFPSNPPVLSLLV